MEQRLCVDRTPVSEAQAFTTDALDERDLDAAATKLLTTELTEKAAPADSVDPIIAVIEEGRRLLSLADAAFAPGVDEDTRMNALRRLADYCRGVLLETVPQTAAGCRELARFAVEYHEHQEVPISDDEHVVASLIAQSPLLSHVEPPADGPEPVSPEDVDPEMGRVQCAEGSHPDAYGLLVGDAGAGVHMPPGSAIVVEPISPAPRDFAVAYFKPGGNPSVWHIGNSFNPVFLDPHPDSELIPQIELFDPVTGRRGFKDARQIEKLHRIQGIYTPTEVRDAFGYAPGDLRLYDEAPEGCIEYVVGDAFNYPVLRAGDIALVDINKTALERGILFLIKHDPSGERCSIMQTNSCRIDTASTTWSADPINRPQGPGMLERRQKAGGIIYASEGPFSEKQLQSMIIGRVIGIRRDVGRVAIGGGA